ncbi:hypothetical protein B0I37DRAFT_427720 [Chaetomium sp. MPI-CAGE-AT-0009]|nr:hypothetical protein B0I37DRAFT_427720 [Chaetomium sp. MPI-CAGE-AT-0009]
METSNNKVPSSKMSSKDAASDRMRRPLPDKQSLEDVHAADLLSSDSRKFTELMCKLLPINHIGNARPNLLGLTELSKPNHDRLLQRMAKWTDAPSRPVDVNQVNDRLLKFLARAPPVSRTPSVSPTPTACSGDERQFIVEEETLAYNALLSDGGRPWYPFNLLEAVSRNYAEHRDMLRFWCSEHHWDVYTKQFDRWKNFRSWQDDNRGVLDIEADFKKLLAEDALWSRGHKQSPEPNNPERQANRLRTLTNQRKREHRHFVEGGVAKMKGENRFPVYVQAAQTRLKRHGFTREFQPARNHLHQDELTTWIEYLNYEYWAHDNLAEEAAQRQPRYEQTLRALLDGEVLLPGETAESVTEFHFHLQLSGEQYRAEEAVKNAESNVEARQEALANTKNSAHRLEQDKSLARLQERLKEAIEALTAIETRVRLIVAYCNAYEPYKVARDKVANHQLLLKWILDQFPLVEAELTEGKYVTTPGGTRTRRLSHEGNLDGPHSQKHDEPCTQIPQEAVPALEPPGQTHSSSGSKRSPTDIDDDDEEESERPTAKRLKLDSQAVRRAQSAPDLHEKAPSSALFGLKRARSNDESEEESKTPTVKRLRPDSQVVRGARPTPELHKQALSSVMSSLKRTLKDDDSEGESEGPTTERLKLDAQATRSRGSGQKLRQAEEGENSEAALDNQAAREGGAQRPTYTEPTAATAAKRPHQTTPAVSRVGQAADPPLPRRSPRIAGLVQAPAATGGEVAKALPEFVPRPATRASKKEAADAQSKKLEPKRPQPAKPPPKKALAKKAPAKKAPAEESSCEESSGEEGSSYEESSGEEGSSYEESSENKAPAKKSPRKKAPAKKAPAKKAPVEKAPAKKAPVEESSAKKAPPKKAPAKTPAPKRAEPKNAPAEKAPTKKAQPKKPELRTVQSLRVQPKRTPPKKPR